MSTSDPTTREVRPLPSSHGWIDTTLTWASPAWIRGMFISAGSQPCHEAGHEGGHHALVGRIVRAPTVIGVVRYSPRSSATSPSVTCALRRRSSSSASIRSPAGGRPSWRCRVRRCSYEHRGYRLPGVRLTPEQYLVNFLDRQRIAFDPGASGNSRAPCRRPDCEVGPAVQDDRALGSDFATQASSAAASRRVR